MFKKYAKLAVLVFLLVMTLRPEARAAGNDNWFYLPAGVNYLDPDNFCNDVVETEFSCSSIHMFRVKPATTYRLYSRDNELCHISTFEFFFYNEDYEEVFASPEYEMSYAFGHITSIVFEMPAGVHFIDMDFMLRSMNAREIEVFRMDELFVFQEGRNVQDENKAYSGPDHFYKFKNNDEVYYHINYSNIIDIADLKNCLYAVDDVDGDITDLIVITEDNYTDNAGNLGVFPVVFAVSDSAGNVATLCIYIVSEDKNIPVISGPFLSLAEPDELLDEQHLLGLLSAEDDYDGDITENIVITSDDYTENYNKKGVYRVNFSVVDTSGNIGFHYMDIDVKDRTAPVITGPDLIRKGNNVHISLTEILIEYYAADNIDGNITDMIEVAENTYSSNPNEVGAHLIKLLVEDNEGNATYYDVTVEVYDATAPVFMIDINKISVTVEGNNIILSDIINNLFQDGDLKTGGVTEIISDNYTGNENTPGDYEVLLKSNDEYSKLTISVAAAIPPEPVKESWFQRVLGFFKGIWKAVKHFFTGTYNHF